MSRLLNPAAMNRPGSFVARASGIVQHSSRAIFPSIVVVYGGVRRYVCSSIRGGLWMVAADLS